MTRAGEPRRIVVVGHPAVMGTELLTVCDLFEIASVLEEQAGRGPAYSVDIASSNGEPINLGHGRTLGGNVVSLSADKRRIHTLVVVGGLAALDVASVDAPLIAAIGKAAKRSDRVVSVCTASFLLAAAGLLDGRRATTHWAVAERLAQDYPAVTVEPDAIFLRDDHVWTSAGVSAAFDLVLALVEEDLGQEQALMLARMAVVYLRRPGGQSQFSVHLATPQARREPIRDVQRYVEENPGADLSVPALAAQANLSPRHFSRLFTTEVGISPGTYVERVRMDAARRALEVSDQSVAVVAAATGFGTAENLRRVFVATLGASPSDYRRRFNPNHGPTLIDAN